MAVLNGPNAVPISSGRKIKTKENRGERKKREKEKEEKEESSNPSRCFLSSPCNDLRSTTRRSSPVWAFKITLCQCHEKLPFPPLSAVIIEITDHYRSVRRVEQKKFIYRGSRRWTARDEHELFSEIDSFGKSWPRLRVIRVFAIRSPFPFLCLSTDKLDRISGFHGSSRCERSRIVATRLRLICCATAENWRRADLFAETFDKRKGHTR